MSRESLILVCATVMIAAAFWNFQQARRERRDAEEAVLHGKTDRGLRTD